jgi:hypothetical protein
MIASKKATWVLASLVAISLMAATASAGILGTNLSYQGCEGSVGFTQGVTDGTLAGTLDFAVFTRDNFLSLSYTGYTPTPGELVYTYQIHNTGTVAISLSKLLLIGGAPADNAGTFLGATVSGQDPYQSFVNGTQNVTWNFSGVAGNTHFILPSGQSMGLAFSSPRKPTTHDINVIVDGGGSVNVPNVAGPGATAIPEPTSLALLAAAAAIAGIAVTRRHRKDN